MKAKLLCVFLWYLCNRKNGFTSKKSSNFDEMYGEAFRVFSLCLEVKGTKFSEALMKGQLLDVL